MSSATSPDAKPLRENLRLPLLVDAAAVVTNGSSSAAAAAPTLTTPTLTPTTLRNIEQMFEENDSQVAEVRPPDTHENAARFEPPTVTLMHAPPPPAYEEITVKSEWIPDGSVLPGPHSNDKPLVALPSSAIPQPAVLVELPSVTAPPPPVRLPTEPVPLIAPPVVSNPVQDLPTEPLPLSSVNIPTVTVPHPPPMSSEDKKKKRTGQTISNGGRKPTITPDMPVDEQRKRLLRRERNKEAAARCRKRRLDQTVMLQDEVDMWEAKKMEMEEDIRKLEKQKRELESALKSHRSECKKNNSAVTTKAEVSVSALLQAAEEVKRKEGKRKVNGRVKQNS